MIYMRGNEKDYNNWAANGNQGWSFRDCLPYFKKLEDMRSPDLGKGKIYAIQKFSHYYFEYNTNNKRRTRD